MAGDLAIQPVAELLMRSTRPQYPLVLSRRFACFRVVIFGIAAGQSDFCDGFDSRQLHKRAADAALLCWVLPADHLYR